MTNRLFECHKCKNNPITIDCSLLSKIQICSVCNVNMGSIPIKCCNTALCHKCSLNYQPLNNFEEEKKWAIKQAELIFGLIDGQIYTVVSCVKGDVFFLLRRNYKYGPIELNFINDIANDNYLLLILDYKYVKN